MSKIRFVNGSRPPTPPTGKTYLYVDELDNHIKTIDDTGAIIDLSATEVFNVNTYTSNDNYTIDTVSNVVFVDCSLKDITITLPLASTINSKVDIKRVDDSAFTLTISTTNSELIDKDTTLTLFPYENISLISSDTQYYIL